MDHGAVLAFWFEEIEPADWWKKDPAFDQRLKDRFGGIHEAAARCELFHWREHPRGRVAEIIVLDQFSRNMYRDHPLSFANDAMALTLAQEAVDRGIDKLLSTDEKAFLYMPYMHSESRKIHEIAVTLFSQPGLEMGLEFEQKHKAIIDRFGRYPHRNKILNRISSEEEVLFLETPDSSF
jgi:uncharacterized protein (DUF924 family)